MRIQSLTVCNLLSRPTAVSERPGQSFQLRLRARQSSLSLKARTFSSSLQVMADLVEYAASSRAACKQCGGLLQKGELRIGRNEPVKGRRGFTKWYHYKCYVQLVPDVTPGGLESLSGYSALKVADQEMLKVYPAAAGKEETPEDTSGTKRGIEEILDGDGEQGGGKRAEKGGDTPCEGGESPAGEGATKHVSAWERILANFSPKSLSKSYKGAALSPGWTSFHSVILKEKDDGLEHGARIAAFDFDGCLVNTDVRRPGAHAWSLMYDSVPAKLKEFHEQKFKIVIFTNESNIDRFVKARQKAVDSKCGRLDGLRSEVGVPFQVFIACGKGGEGDTCRKPAAGMWDLLERHFNGGVAIDKSSSFFVGDAAGRPKDHSAADKDFAKAVGIKFLLPEDVFLSK
eukprot:TRINITY_DN14962_c0_g1_i1.p1 TRINITY_DN14962_c0_g1~~TRINITY_DN14962_c0_g1_i1.p1  ORF type:complete len:401 (-),score=78.26 TRINITY_DN14962_c0_g1_i1:585-1787(-)